MSSPAMERTKTPGVYKRGGRYCIIYRDLRGRQRKRAARTYAEAKALKAQLTSAVATGEYREQSRSTFAEYALEWIVTYAGRTSRGIRPETRDDYRRDLGIGKDGELLDDGAIAYFGRSRLTEIEPRHIKGYASLLAKQGLSPASVRNALAPVRALLATAFEEGLIRSNPSARVRIATQAREEAEEQKAKALSEEQLRDLFEALKCQPCQREPRHDCGGCASWRLFVIFLVHTGLRIGEAVALQWGDVDLGQRRIHVRRRLYRGRIDTPKSRYGRRTIPLSPTLAQQLWLHRAADVDIEAPVFPSQTGGMLDASNLLARVLKPAARAAGVPWASWHTLRHTCASRLFTKAELNAKQVQAWLGHHSPAFTLAIYVHLLPDDLPDASALDELELGGLEVATGEATRAAESGRDDENGTTLEKAV